jgi:hypothetical protein
MFVLNSCNHFFLPLSFLLLPLWSKGQPWNALFHFSFLILRQSVGLLWREISPSQGRYIQRTTQTQHKRKHISMLSVGFEPTILCSSERKQFMPQMRGHCDRPSNN